MSIIRNLTTMAFGRHLLLTNTVSSGIIYGMGDLVEQEIMIQTNGHEKGRYRYEWDRIRNLFIVGVVLGPVNHCFYKWIDKRLPRRNFRTIAKKIVLDQLVMSPVCTCTFFLLTNFLEGKRFKDGFGELKEKFPTVYMVDWMVWPGIQFINFYKVPPSYRVLYVNVSQLSWNVFLCFSKFDF